MSDQNGYAILEVSGSEYPLLVVMPDVFFDSFNTSLYEMFGFTSEAEYEQMLRDNNPRLDLTEESCTYQGINLLEMYYYDQAAEKAVQITDAKSSGEYADVSLKLKKAGKIDTIQRSVGITYTITGINKMNYNALDIERVVLVGSDAEKFDVSDVRFNAKGMAFVTVIPKPDIDLHTNINYQYQLKALYGTEENAFYVLSADLKVKPSQSKISTAKESGCILSFDPNLREPLWDTLDEAKEQIAYAAAALITTKKGALKVMPTREEVEKLIGQK